MKTILTIFCVLAALFGGGCALTIGANAGPVALLPLAVLVLNCLILAALWGSKTPWPPAFYILGVIDLLIALGMVVFLFFLGGGFDLYLLPFVLLPIAFALKGYLALKYVRTL